MNLLSKECVYKIIISTNMHLDYNHIIDPSLMGECGKEFIAKILIKRVIRQRLDRPYGQCIDYSSQTVRPFGAVSQSHCRRLCLRDFFRKKYNCSPLFVDHYTHSQDIQDNFE